MSTPPESPPSPSTPSIATTATSAATEDNFPLETAALIRTGKINLFPYCLRQEKQMQMTFSAVSHLLEEEGRERKEAAGELHHHQGVVGDGDELDFCEKLPGQAEILQEELEEECRSIEAEMARVKLQKERLLKGLEEDKLERERVTGVLVTNGSEGGGGILLQKNETRRRPLPEKKKEPWKKQRKAVNESENVISCPNCCGSMIRAQDAAKHNLVCPCREVQCPLVGCEAMILYRDIEKHQQTRCKVAKRRRKLLREKEARQKEKEEKRRLEEVEETNPSPQKSILTDGELLERNIREKMVEKSRIRHKLQEENRLFELEDHRKRQREYESTQFDIFDVDPDVDERAERARIRHKEVECPNCGTPVVRMWLQKHLVNSCMNRKVPCRNWELGCPTMVRLRDRATHEQVEHLLKPRPCLKFTGNAGYIDVKEEVS